MGDFKIIERGTLYDAAGRPEAERAACLPDLCLTGSGALFSTFQLGRVKNAPDSTLRVCRSYDRGRTWQEMPFAFETRFSGTAGSLSAGQMVEAEPGRLLLLATWMDRTDPDRPMFDPATEGILHTKILKSYSTDEGAGWSDWEEVQLPGMRFCPHSSGPIVPWRDGAFALPIESHKPFDDPDPSRRDVQASWLIISRDYGRTFTGPHLVAQHPEHTTYYWDQRVCPGRRPGEFVALFWTHDRSRGQDIAVHLRRGQLAGEGVSTGPIVDTGMPGQIAAPLVLPSGRMLALVVDRQWPGKIEIWRSDGDDRRWTELSPAYVHRGTARSAYASGEVVGYTEVWETLEKWRFGCPAIKALGDGVAVITYYAGMDHHLGVHWVRIGLPE